jgi:hypothetical protein
MVSTAAAKIQKATRTLRPLPCSNSLQAPAHLTGNPRLTQNAFSVSVNRAHWIGFASMYHSQKKKPKKKITPTRMEISGSMLDYFRNSIAILRHRQ